VSPIFVRPVREQAEHDRLIRFLQARYKRKFEVAANVADEQLAPVRVGTSVVFPDLVLTADRKVAGVVEGESGEPVNNLEAMAEWVPYSKVRAAFHLYVPVTAFDTARRLCEAHRASVTELWTYRPTFDGFDLVRMIHTPQPAASGARRKASSATRGAASKKGKAATSRGRVARPAAGKARKAAKPVRAAASRTTRKAAAKSAKPARKAARPSRATKGRPSRAATAAARKPTNATKASKSRRK